MTTPIHSAHDLPDRLRELSSEMMTTSTAMAYFGGFNAEMADHAAEMAGAAVIAAGWADVIEDELKSPKKKDEK